MKRKKKSDFKVNLALFLSLITFLYVFKNEFNLKFIDSNTLTLDHCIDGDTASFQEIGTVRFLLVDTPESKGKYASNPQPYGIEAANFTCALLESANIIKIEYDGPKTDKYNRTLGWIFVDGELLQQKIAEAGYVQKFYDYGTYKYEYEVKKALNDQYDIFH